MSANDAPPAQQASAGFFGRLWGKGEVKRKAIKANLGERNTLFYDEKLKRWRKEGEEISEADLEPPPPPVIGSGFSTQAGGDSQNQRRGTGRYADAGGFGRENSSTSSSSFLPRPNTAPNVQAPFVPPQPAGAPKFFVPGGAAVGGSTPGAFAPSWGGFGQAGGAGGQGLSPRQPVSGHSTPKVQSPSPKSRPSPKSEPPPRRGKSPRHAEEGDELSWQQWRVQDEERRERERQEAASLGEQVMDSFTAAAPEPEETDTISGAGRFAAEVELAGDAESWPQGLSQEESVGDNIQRETSGPSFAAWNPRAGDDGAVTSPARAFPPIVEAVEGESHLQDMPDGYGDAFFGGNLPADASAATLQDWNVEGGPEREAEGVSGAALEGEPPQEWEQTYGGMTWAQLQEWAEYYRQEGSPDDEVRTWVDGYLANPDPYPGELPEGAPADYATAAADQMGESFELHEAVSGNRQQGFEQEGQQPEGKWAENAQGGGFLAEEPPTDAADLMTQLREYVEVQRASDPSFGKLKSPLPWDGILTSDDESPLTSPRLRLGSGKKKAAAPQAEAEKAVPTIPQIQEFVDNLSKTANNALGASWLDKIRQNLAQDEAAQQQQPAPSASEPAASASDQKPGAPSVLPEAAEVLPRQSFQGTPRSGEHFGGSRSSTPRIGATGLSRVEVLRQGASPSSQAGRVSRGHTPSHAAPPQPQLFGGEDVLSLGSSPQSGLSANAGSKTSPVRAVQEEQPAVSNAAEQSASLAHWQREDEAAPTGDEEVDQPTDEGGWGAEVDGWGPEGLENGTDPNSHPLRSAEVSSAGMVDELTAEAQQLPPLHIKPLTPQAAQQPEPPFSNSKALIAEVEELKRQLMASQTEKDQVSEDLATLQDQNGKLEMELSDLKSTIDSEIAAAEGRAGSRALKELEGTHSAEIDAERAELAVARAEADALRAQFAAERRGLEEQLAALKAQPSARGVETDSLSIPEEERSKLEEARAELAGREAALDEEFAHLGAEREDLIQENERLLADREEFEAERDALAADRQRLAAEQSSLAQQKEGLTAERAALEREAGALESEREDFFKQQEALRVQERSVQEASSVAEKKLQQQLASLQSELQQLRSANAALADEQATMTNENESLAEESLAKDEEIEQLTGQLVHLRKELENKPASIGMTAEEAKQLREQATLDFQRIAMLDQQNQELQDQIEELEAAVGVPGENPEQAAREEENASLKARLEASEHDAEELRKDLAVSKAELESLTARLTEASDLALAFEKERDAVAGQIAALTAGRDSLAKENAILKKKAARAEARAAKSAKSAEEAEELRQKLAVAEEAAAAGAEAVAENDSLASKLANANLKAAALEADLENLTASRDEVDSELAALHDQHLAAQAESDSAAAAASAEQQRLSAELAEAGRKIASLEKAAQSTELLKAQILELQQEVSGFEEASAAKQEELSALSQKVVEAERLQAQVSSLAQERDDLLEKIEGMQSELADATELAKVSAAETDRLAKDAAAHEQARLELSRLQAELADATSNLKDANARVSELEAQLSSSSAGSKEGEQRVAKLSERVRELEEENEEMFARLSAMEEEADESVGKLHAAHEKLAAAERLRVEAEQKLTISHTTVSQEAQEKLQAVEAELAALKAELQSAQQQLVSAEQAEDELRSQLEAQKQELLHSKVQQPVASSIPDSSVADLEAQLAEKEQDFTDLMVCLGQETAKVEALSDRLQQQGVDVLSILEQVEESYGFGDEAPADEAEQKLGGGSAADLEWLENPLEDADGDWGV